MIKMRKPRIFIASSTESLKVANAINVNLEHVSEVTVWKNTFTLASNTLEDLVTKSSTYDFAIFVFTPDDISWIREKTKHTVRDNVLFELGIFMGTLGKKRCFVVRPRDVDLYIPTDLLGLTSADYDASRSDGDLNSAVNYSCALIIKEVEKLGVLSPNVEVRTKERLRISRSYNLGVVEHSLLAKVLESYPDGPNGVSVWQTFSHLQQLGKDRLGLAAVKLERMGYLSRRILSNGEGDEFYAFSITEDGLDYILQNEGLFAGSGQRSDRQSADDITPDDEIPF